MKTEKTVVAESTNHLICLCHCAMKEKGGKVDLNFIDTSKITDMEGIFAHCDIEFRGDVSEWNVSNVENMACLFANCPGFNGDLSKWDTGNVKDMSYMFSDAMTFFGDISNWDVSNVELADGMFMDCPIAEDNKPKLELQEA